MKIKLEQEFAMFRDEGSTAEYFGVPFTCKHVKITGGKREGTIESQWYAELSDKDGQAMVDAYRATKVDVPKDEPKQDNNRR